jgi:predicted GH43/DUF377 family glycosyl hydrolase
MGQKTQPELRCGASKAYCCLGKIGDCLSIFPILLHEYQERGIKTPLVVSKDYADILEGVTYADPVIYDGGFGDIKGALRFAKQRFHKVIVLQMHGMGYEVERLTPSYQLDSWLRARCVGYFQDWPLVINNRSGLRERILFKNTVNRTEHKGRPLEKYMLLADHSQSSPFPHIEELAEMLKKEFEPAIRVIRLSMVKAVKIFDLLALYEKAEALVTIETVHIHLSKASSVSTIVLAADGWRGSAQHKRFRFYARYSEWQIRKKRLMFEVGDAVRGKVGPSMVEFRTAKPNGYNPSMIEWNGDIVRSYRYHPDSDWKTLISIIDKDGDQPLEMPESLKGYSVEDMRLFTHQGKLHASYTVSTTRQKQFFCVIAYGELVKEGHGWRLASHIIPKYPQNDFSATVKNWVFWEMGGKLFALYGIRKDQQLVIQIEGDKVVKEFNSPAPTWPNGQIRGDAIVPHGGNLLRIFHSRDDYSKDRFRYFIGAALMEPEPPFRTIKVSTASILQGDEIYYPNWARWKPNVVLCCGCVRQSGNLLLSVGLNDSRAATVELTEKDLHLS